MKKDIHWDPLLRVMTVSGGTWEDPVTPADIGKAVEEYGLSDPFCFTMEVG